MTQKKKIAFESNIKNRNSRERNRIVIKSNNYIRKPLNDKFNETDRKIGKTISESKFSNYNSKTLNSRVYRAINNKSQDFVTKDIKRKARGLSVIQKGPKNKFVIKGVKQKPPSLKDLRRREEKPKNEIAKSFAPFLTKNKEDSPKKINRSVNNNLVEIKCISARPSNKMNIPSIINSRTKDKNNDNNSNVSMVSISNISNTNNASKKNIDNSIVNKNNDKKNDNTNNILSIDINANSKNNDNNTNNKDNNSNKLIIILSSNNKNNNNNDSINKKNNDKNNDKKNEEYENILKKVDSIVYEKEAEIDKLTAQIGDLNFTIKSQKADIDDLTKERDELQKSVVDLSTQVQEHKDLMSINRTEKEYQALIEQLNDTITSLENRILKIEDSTIVDENSKEKISDALSTKISDFQEEINNLTKKIKNCAVLKSQNEIKLKLSKAEALKSKSLKEQLKTDIIEGQRENFKLIMEEESTNKRIGTRIKYLELKLNKIVKKIPSILDKDYDDIMVKMDL